jgi:hypothetical protein
MSIRQKLSVSLNGLSFPFTLFDTLPTILSTGFFIGPKRDLKLPTPRRMTGSNPSGTRLACERKGLVFLRGGEARLPHGRLGQRGVHVVRPVLENVLGCSAGRFVERLEAPRGVALFRQGEP